MKTLMVLIFKYESTSSDVALNAAMSCFPDSASLRLAGSLTDARDLAALFEKQPPNFFDVKIDDSEIRLNRLGHRKFDAMRITAPWDFDKCITSVLPLLKAGSFLHGWAIDYDYSYWQNAKRKVQYRSGGRTHEGLPKCLNEFGDEEVIDISANPGREVFHQGYLEAVGGVQWFGTGFWGITGAKLGSVEKLPFLVVERIESITQVVLDKDLLAHAEGNEVLSERQNNLRALLFPNRAEKN